MNDTWTAADPIRPPDTDDEPWAVVDESGQRGTWLGCLLLLAVFALAFIAGRLTA